HDGASQRYHGDGVRLLELASRAYELYAKQSAEQKNKFLRIMLSNCTLKDGSLQPTYKKPFDILARGVESRNWGE
ncbi:MAG: recombinase family protein, partial [Nitrospirota bacterium]|nr:recombinase family protein [Nitrospirota bacterium]